MGRVPPPPRCLGAGEFALGQATRAGAPRAVGRSARQRRAHGRRGSRAPRRGRATRITRWSRSQDRSDRAARRGRGPRARLPPGSERWRGSRRASTAAYHRCYRGARADTIGFCGNTAAAPMPQRSGTTAPRPRLRGGSPRPPGPRAAWWKDPRRRHRDHLLSDGSTCTRAFDTFNPPTARRPTGSSALTWTSRSKPSRGATRLLWIKWPRACRGRRSVVLRRVVAAAGVLARSRAAPAARPPEYRSTRGAPFLWPLRSSWTRRTSSSQLRKASGTTCSFLVRRRPLHARAGDRAVQRRLRLD